MTSDSQRPISPHLQIYRLPLTALVSIAHRITGAVLFVGAVLLTWVLAALAGGAESYAHVQPVLQSWIGQAILFGSCFALFLHLCNGIRHLFWDAGKGFELTTADFTAKLAIVVALLLTIAIWVISAGAN